MKTIEAILKYNIGFDPTKHDELFLTKTIKKRVIDTKTNSLDEYYELLLNNNNECHNLVESLQVNYTTFFRNQLTFIILETIILPQIIQQKKNLKNKEIRIWSAACASGQEPYSLAILLEELLCNRPNFTYRIFATDQNEQLIKQAKDGFYFDHEMGNITYNRLQTWFDYNNNKYEVTEQLKKNIDFSVLNLLNASYISPPSSIFGNFDLVICANLLFYYKTEYRNEIINKMVKSLSNKGFLVTGEAERELLTRQGLTEAYPQSGIFQSITLQTPIIRNLNSK